MKKVDIEKSAQKRCDRRYSYLHNSAFYDGFMQGADWRINSVWHDASQEPTEKKIIVVINLEDVISQISFLVEADNWNDCVKEADIVKWCYKEDLLPNMEE